MQPTCFLREHAEYPRLFRCASISSTYPGQSLSRSYFRISVLSESLSQWPARVSILEISLLDLDLEAFSFHFSISSYFYFTFISGSQFQVTFFHFSKKVNGIFSSLFTSRLSKTHSRRTLLWITDIFSGGKTLASVFGNQIHRTRRCQRQSPKTFATFGTRRLLSLITAVSAGLGRVAKCM